MGGVHLFVLVFGSLQALSGPRLWSACCCCCLSWWASMHLALTPHTPAHPPPRPRLRAAGAQPILRWHTRLIMSPGVDEPHPANKKARCSVYLRDLQREADLSDAALQYIARICGPRCVRSGAPAAHAEARVHEVVVLVRSKLCSVRVAWLPLQGACCRVLAPPAPGFQPHPFHSGAPPANPRSLPPRAPQPNRALPQVHPANANRVLAPDPRRGAGTTPAPGSCC